MIHDVLFILQSWNHWIDSFYTLLFNLKNLRMCVITISMFIVPWHSLSKHDCWFSFAFKCGWMKQFVLSIIMSGVFSGSALKLQLITFIKITFYHICWNCEYIQKVHEIVNLWRKISLLLFLMTFARMHRDWTKTTNQNRRFCYCDM